MVHGSDDVLRCYEVFISHRVHTDDDELIDQLYDEFLRRTVASEKRAIQVF